MIRGECCMFEVKPICGILGLGKQGENLARMIYFDEPSTWKETFGEGKCELLHQRNGDAAPYPVVLDIEDGRACWKITSSDTACIGEGKCEIRYSVDGVIVKSKTWVTSVLPSLGDGAEEAPEPYKAWVDAVLNAAERVESMLGVDCVSGSKGYYIQGIDFAAKKIYLTSEETIPVTGSGTADADFETPAYASGDVFSVVSSGTFPFCGVIESITNNVVTWSSVDPYFESRGLDKVVSLFSVPTKPQIGVVVFGENSFSFGKDNNSAGWYTFSAGEGNVIGGDYSAGFGKNNKVGFGSAGFGVFNNFPGQWNVGGGSNNTSDLRTRASIIGGYGNSIMGSGYGLYTGNGNITNAAIYAILSGNLNKLSGNYNILNGDSNDVLASFVLALGKYLKTETDHQMILGQWNALNPNAAILYGNGTSDRNRKNAFEINKDGSAKFASVTDLAGKKYLKETDGYLKEDGQYNLKRGVNITITGTYNDAVGKSITITGESNVLKGQYLSCEGNFNYIEGRSNHTTGDFNFVRGNFLTASGNQTVLGKYNVDDPDKIFILGGGTSLQRKNIFTIDREGRVAFVEN